MNRFHSLLPAFAALLFAISPLGVQAIGEPRLVVDLAPGAASSNPEWPANVGERLFFSTGVLGERKLWKSDGTAAGTVLVYPESGSVNSVYGIVSMGGVAYYGSFYGAAATQLWRSDGTLGGTYSLRSGAVPRGAVPDYLTVMGNTLFFGVLDSGWLDRPLWKTDGTQAGTVRVTAEINPGLGNDSVHALVNFQGALFFGAFDGQYVDIWKSDGTAAGTIRVTDRLFEPAQRLAHATDYNGLLTFTASDAAGVRRLWTSTGTAAGTKPVFGANDARSPSNPRFLQSAQGLLFFVADSANGNALWQSDGTATGTKPIIEFPAPGIASLFELNGRLYFGASGSRGSGLWTSDGTETGTVLVRSFSVGSNPVQTERAWFAYMSGSLYFPADDGLSGMELWALPDARPSDLSAQVMRYYRATLRRSGEANGRAFWESEANRMNALGIGLDEAWYAMGITFLTSPEYAAFQRDSVEYVRDLYRTFLNRFADDSGLAFWTGQLEAGMPRESVLNSFMFSPEFALLTRAAFGPASTRPEAMAVADFYRGLLGRLPDSAGFNYWLGRFRTAQCRGREALNAEIETISSAFHNSAESVARGRTNRQFVADLYNAFLRRGADREGVLAWTSFLDGSPRDDLRRQFIASPEFQSRVSEISAAGCAA